MSGRKSSKGSTPDRDNRFEYPDPTPVAVPVRLQGGASHYDEIKQMIRVAMSDAAASKDYETWEEANDFDLDFEDEPDFVSKYEFEELVPETNEAIDPRPSFVDPSHAPEQNRPPPTEGQQGRGSTQPSQETLPAETAGGTPLQGATPNNSGSASASQ